MSDEEDLTTKPKIQCDFPGCGTVCASPSIMNRHMRSHTGEKPYSCPNCQKSFSQVGNLTKRIRSHEIRHLRWDRKANTKPFKCSHPGCTRSFVAKSSLQNHILSQHTSTTQLQEMNNQHFQHIKDSMSLSSGDDGEAQALNNSPDLRKYLFEQIPPAVVAEHAFLFKTVIQFADMIATWDQTTPDKQNDLKSYVATVQRTVQRSLVSSKRMKMSSDEEESISSNSRKQSNQLQNSERVTTLTTFVTSDDLWSSLAKDKELIEILSNMVDDDEEDENQVEDVEPVIEIEKRNTIPTPSNTMETTNSVTGLNTPLIRTNRDENHTTNDHHLKYHPIKTENCSITIEATFPLHSTAAAATTFHCELGGDDFLDERRKTPRK